MDSYRQDRRYKYYAEECMGGFAFENGREVCRTYHGPLCLLCLLCMMSLLCLLHSTWWWWRSPVPTRVCI